MQLKSNALGFLTATLITLPAIAWEREEGKAAPIIQANIAESISISSIKGEIRGRNVKIAYELSNTTNQPINATLSTYSEPYQWQGYAAEYTALHFPELKISTNSYPLNKETFTHAWLNGQDITSKLKSTGIDPYLVSETEAPLPISILKGRHAASWLLSVAFQKREDIAIPNWLIQQNSRWTMQLPSRAVSSVVVEYVARPAIREVAVDSPDFASTVYRHCSDPATIKKILASNPSRSTDTVRISEQILPLQFGNAPIPATQFSFSAEPSTAGLESLATLSCGPEDASIEGLPSIQLTNAGYKRELRILSIMAQRR